MNKELDNELRHLRLNLASFGDDELLSALDVEAIKEVFARNGWVNARTYATEDVKGETVPFEVLAHALGLMTGKEFYDRFEDALDKDAQVLGQDASWSLRAAKKAANLGENI